MSVRVLGEFRRAPDGAGLPAADHRVQPDSAAEMAELLATATEEGAVVVPWGAGIHQGLGNPIVPDVVASTRALNKILAWEPDDLTVVVEAGVTLGELEETIAVRRQTAAFPATTPDAT
ncbi:MAG: FAD-binding protein, partial [Acidimicrobiia bacterium]|nr:FAD-binding protein [Acidimicrobiia bacterium]